MKNVHIFIRKKNSVFHQSIERFVYQLKKNINHNRLNIKILECPLASVGIFNRVYLIFWAFFNQGHVNHISGDINYISLFLSKKKTINTFLDCRLLNEFIGIKKFIYKLLWFYMPMHKSYINTCISNFTKNEIKKNFKKKDKINFKVLPVPLVQKYCSNINHKIKKILIIGTEKHKNIENSLKALTGLTITLIIVGKLDKNCRDLIKRSNIKYKNHVNITNKKLNKIYKTCNILLMPSTYEGFGMPILEAQISSMPVITSDKEPMKNLAGKNALKVNPNKIFEIRKAIKKLINNDSYFNKLSRLGIINALKYEGKLVNKAYLNLYLKTLNNEYK
jgi:glycosyltransferase involved in cell wall biosynthesis